MKGNEAIIKHILVALDTSHHSLAALEAAVELAATLKAELHGLFVEDANLLRAAGSPAVREVSYPYVAGSRLSRPRLERQLRAQATQAKRALATASKRREVRWSFRVARGEVASEVVSAAQEADILILGKISRPLVRRVRLGSTALAAAVQAPCCVFLLQQGTGVRPPIMVTYDGSPTARRALRIATHLARQNGGYLAILVAPNTQNGEQRLPPEITEWLRRQGVLVRLQRLENTSVATLIRAIRSGGNGTLVLSSTILHLASLQKLLDEVDCPVLLVREPHP